MVKTELRKERKGRNESKTVGVRWRRALKRHEERMEEHRHFIDAARDALRQQGPQAPAKGSARRRTARQAPAED